MRTVNLGEVLPNDERVFLVPDMRELGGFNGKDDFGADEALLLQEGFDTFGVGSVSRPLTTPKRPFSSKKASIWIFQSS